MMELSLRINPKLYNARLRQKGCNLNTAMSCRANKVAMKKERSNLYEVLSLGSERVGFEEIKKAYKSMALLYHPDVCPPSAKEESTRRFVELTKAYETLSDPASRRMYDYELGLVGSLGGFCLEERRASFSREVWEMQLYGLRKRSADRLERQREMDTSCERRACL